MTDERKKRIPINHQDDHKDDHHRDDREEETAEGRQAPSEASHPGAEGNGADAPVEEDRSGGRPVDGAEVRDSADVGHSADVGREGDDGVIDDRLSAALAERDGYLNDLRRLKAEFENYRRRSQRELAEVRAMARGAMVLEFLPILDNLERALDAAAEHEEAKLIDGVRMTHGAFLDLLQREGVERVDPLGDPFDPEVHEALFAQASDHPEGTVVYVMEPGYVLGERLLRPAKVAVSSGPEGEEG